MKFKDYVKMLADYLNDNPDSEDLDVVYVSDDEGNACYELYREKPIPGIFDGEYGGTILTYKEDIDDHIENYPDAKINAICIN